MTKPSVNELTAFPLFPIGTRGKPWEDAERAEWLKTRVRERDYFGMVVSPLMRIPDAEIFQYGELDYRPQGAALYPLFGARSKNWNTALPLFVVTGGVHGYETSGFMGAVHFAARHMKMAEGKMNVLVLPCISPWGMEHVERWNPAASDPNRFWDPSLNDPRCQEAFLGMKAIKEHEARSSRIFVHIDCHETTDTDNLVFTPAKFARDGKITEDQPYEEIPIGFYLVNGLGGKPSLPSQFEFDRVLIEAVSKVTKIAEAGKDGTLIGEKVTQRGVCECDGREWKLCGAHTDAPFSTTTEVYPDAEGVTPEECIEAQIACCRAAMEFALNALAANDGTGDTK